jgi:hypothetical protein
MLTRSVYLPEGVMAMKSAYGWLAAAVLAAGLNSTYQNGGFEWAHRAAERALESSGAVLALATGRADQFLADAQLLNAREERPSCPLATALARVQTTLARNVAGLDRFQAMSARAMSVQQEEQLARLEVNRARIEEQLAHTARLGAMIRLEPASFNLASFNPVERTACARVHVPRVPHIRVSAPVVQVEMVGAGPL